MVQFKDLTEVTVRNLWREVKDEEDWWGDLKEESLWVVRRLMETKELANSCHLVLDEGKVVAVGWDEVQSVGQSPRPSVGLA